MPVPVPEIDWEVGSFTLRSGSTAGSCIKYVPRVGQTGVLTTPINSDGTTTFPTGYTGWGGIGVAGIVAGVKSTSGAPADADFTGATPAIAAPPVGTLIYNTNLHKLCARDAAGSWLISSVFS